MKRNWVLITTSDLKSLNLCHLMVLTIIIWSKIIRVSIRKTFAQFLRNETQNFSFVAYSFAQKNSNLRNRSQKSFRAKLPYSAFLQFKFCAIPQFRYNHMCVFLGIERFFSPVSEFRKNLVLECLAIGHFNLHTTYLTIMPVKMSS